MTGTERAFSSLKVGYNHGYAAANKPSQGRGNSKWQKQAYSHSSWVQGRNQHNNSSKNWNHRGKTSHEDTYNSQHRSVSNNQANIKPQCNTCQKFHFGLCRYKGKPRCGRCNFFGHNTKDCNNFKTVANSAKEEEEVTTGTLFYACHAASVKEDDVWFVDSACSNHMTSNESMLINVDRSIVCKVKMGSGDLVPAMSVGQMMEHGYYILFGGNKAIIFDDARLENVIAKVIMKGNRCFPLSLESLLPYFSLPKFVFFIIFHKLPKLKP